MSWREQCYLPRGDTQWWSKALLQHGNIRPQTLIYGYRCVDILTSHKKVFSMKTSTCRDGTLKNQPNKIGTTPQYFYTIPTSCAILPTMHCVCYLCAQKGCLGHGSLWNEQYWVCSARCCVWRVHCVVGGCNFVTVECGRHG